MSGSLSILADPPAPPAPIGLIAGSGRLPILVARGLANLGHPVHGLGLLRQYDDELPGLCESFSDVGLLRLGGWAKRLKQAGCRHAIMVGRVDKSGLMHDRFRVFKNIPDLRTAISWHRHLRHDRRSHAVLLAIAEELDRQGVSLIDSTSPIPDYLSRAGVMTLSRPTREQESDIEFAWPLLTELLRLDIGQSIAVREKDVICVEAVEGTDKMIERGGQICRVKGWTLCKGARAEHDRRSDVPTVGIQTLENMHKAGGRCLAIAAGDVIMLDREEMIQVADRLGISIVGVPVAHATSQSSVESRSVGVTTAPTAG